MKVLDLYCGAGGAAMGYRQAGFDEVVGIDNVWQPDYPFNFIRDEAEAYLRLYGVRYDFIHASPPCQAFSCTSSLNYDYDKVLRAYANMSRLRDTLIATGRPYIIENVPGAPLIAPIRLCGSSFNLAVRRHRIFEASLKLSPLPCRHPVGIRAIGVYGSHPEDSTGTRHNRAKTLEEGREAMGIDWMQWAQLTQAIPPAYTEYLGRQVLECLNITG